MKEKTSQHDESGSQRPFLKRLQKKVDQLSYFLTRVKEAHLDPDEGARLQTLSLEISELGKCIKIESITQLIQELSEDVRPLTDHPSSVLELSDKLNAIQVTLQKLQMLITLEINNDYTLIDPTATVSKKCLLISLQNKLFSEEIAQQLESFNYDCKILETMEEIIEFSEKNHNVRVILLDAGFCRDPISQSRIKALSAQIPIIFISSTDDAAMRLLAVKTGGIAYITTPIDFANLIEKIDQILKPEYEKSPFRILIVEDSLTQASVLSKKLKNAGMIVEILTNPLLISHLLTEFRPDLILLDLYMPECTGVELTKVIRQQDSFVSIPIVYLSIEEDFQKQFQAVSFGGDDFLPKSISTEKLISSITTRVLRYRTLHAEMVQDSLTGLLNHTRILELLNLEIARIKRNNAPLSFVMIDLDDFKRINDTYGHPVGDRVIKSLARILKQRLRKTDSIGRYGGEEFAVILPQTQASTVFQTLEDIRQTFAKLVHQVNHSTEEFSITFSAGLAEYSNTINTLEKLVQAADHALYLAKKQGSNQVVLYNPS